MNMTCNTPCDGNVCITSKLWDTTAGLAHAFAGVGLILVPVVLLRRWVHPKWTMLVTSIVFIVYVLAKELWYDDVYESLMESGGVPNFLDMLTYFAGMIIGNLVSILVFPEYDLHRDIAFSHLSQSDMQNVADSVINRIYSL